MNDTRQVDNEKQEKTYYQIVVGTFENYGNEYIKNLEV